MEGLKNSPIEVNRQFESKLSIAVEKELGLDNLKNLITFSKSLQEEFQQQNSDVHLALVGGNLMPEKQGKFHKDMDFIVSSPNLNTNPSPKEDDPDFAKFTQFITSIGNKLNWDVKVNPPWFMDYECSFDGSVNLIPPTGVPLEILSVGKNPLKSDSRPSVVLF
jgi:hypothetical protein